ncbi:trypsin-like serine peptidase [Streptomyces arboris]|uniref:trypsin-like serine peptidase n=1 Tax=Streptomyces arboris TaxID=2600619 RepID=UPI003C2D0B97
MASVFALLVPATASAVPTGSAGAEPPPAVVDTHDSEQTDQEIRTFWTPERREEALRNPAKAPAPRPAPGRTTRSSAPPHDVTASAPARGFAASTPLSPANAAPGMPVSQEAPTGPGYNVVGKLYFFTPGGEPSHCSAASIVTANKNTIWTAGHCVHQGDGSGDAGWNKHFLYVPGYSRGAEPLGEWTAARQFAPSAWTQDGDAYEADVAAVVLNPRLDGNLEDVVGFALGYQFTENRTDYANSAVMGYPGEGYQRSDLDGERLMYCAGDTTDAFPLNPFDDRITFDCDMGKGASGGPFVWGPENDPRIVGTASHVTTDDAGQRINDDLFSSEHGSYAAAVINTANGA